VDFPTKYDGSSFSELLAAEHPQLSFASRFKDLTIPQAGIDRIPHGTTVLALKYEGGVVVAGDRLATAGYQVASRDVRKVYPVDSHSLIAIAGAAGPCIELARLLAIELEHYEKIEGEQLELDGKANKLSTMIRANLPMAMQGLAIIPLYAGFDCRRNTGRIWKFDVTGGRYEEQDYETTGSGSNFARDSLKKSYRKNASRGDAVLAAIEALRDAADEDRGTGSIDLLRKIYPIVCVCSQEGIEDVTDAEIAEIYQALMRRLEEER